MESEEVGINELYAEDPVEADRRLWGRETGPDRRGFLKGAGLSSLAAALGAAIPFHPQMPAGLIPVALGQSNKRELLKTKDGLTVLNDRPINAETPPHLLDDPVTPAERHFVRNNGLVPEKAAKGEASGWTLTVDGEVEKSLTMSIDELKRRFDVVKRRLVIECGGNGRAFYNPGASGNQWTLGAVSCSEWTGVRLRDVLEEAGLKDSAVYTGHYGADKHPSRDPNKEALSRGVPIEKAMDENNLIAFECNGKPIPALNGFPLRLVIPGWPGSCSQKWLTRIWVRDRKHDGKKMAAPSYSVPKYPVPPGADVPLEDFETIHSMPVKSLITRPRTGVRVKPGERIEVGGHAWAGDLTVRDMHVSVDFGQTWQRAELDEPVNPYAWQHWRTTVKLPQKGYYEVWARATDSEGAMQPPVTPGWNPKGYINNMQHRVAVFAE